MVRTTLRIRFAARLAAFVGRRRSLTVCARLAVAWPRATTTVEAAAKARLQIRAAPAPLAPAFSRSLRATLAGMVADASMRPARAATTLRVRPLANAARVAR